jgi:c(7)-type cytochrome triheme protein
MKIRGHIAALLLSFVFSGSAIAVPPGETAEFNNSPEGKVTFDGTKHKNAGFKCAVCHAETFEMERKIKIMKEDHESGKACFTCHADGGKSFAAKDNCERCHKK